MSGVVRDSTVHLRPDPVPVAGLGAVVSPGFGRLKAEPPKRLPPAAGVEAGAGVVPEVEVAFAALLPPPKRFPVGAPVEPALPNRFPVAGVVDVVAPPPNKLVVGAGVVVAGLVPKKLLPVVEPEVDVVLAAPNKFPEGAAAVGVVVLLPPKRPPPVWLLLDAAPNRFPPEPNAFVVEPVCG